MKPTRAVALIIGMWAFSGWGWGVAQAAEPSRESSFKEWCQKLTSLSAERQKTVEVLLAQAGTSDCELAAENLLSRTELYLSQTGISDLSPLSGLTNLTKLTLRENQIADIRPLAELTNLQELFLIHNQIADVSPLARLTNLEVLELSENQITDVSSLARLTNLTELFLSFNPITDVRPLAKLTNLNRLDLEGHQITDTADCRFMKYTLQIIYKLPLIK
jgi:internalin A